MERGLNKSIRSARERAFSLIEILVVVALVVILSVLTIPALTSTQSALEITRAAQGLSDSLNLARQTALARNRTVTLRFFRNVGETNFNAYQIALIQDDGAEEPRRLTRLPQGVVLSGNAAHSAGFSITGNTNLQSGQQVDYSELRFRRDGSADLGSADDWFVSIVREKDAKEDVPVNFVAVLVEPSSGTTRIFRP